MQLLSPFSKHLDDAVKLFKLVLAGEGLITRDTLGADFLAQCGRLGPMCSCTYNYSPPIVPPAGA